MSLNGSWPLFLWGPDAALNHGRVVGRPDGPLGGKEGAWGQKAEENGVKLRSWQR